MTNIISQVTCSLCNMTIDELKWKQHLVSTSYLQWRIIVKNRIARKYFEMILMHVPRNVKKNK